MQKGWLQYFAVTTRNIFILLLLTCHTAVQAQTEKYFQSLTGNIKAGDSCVVTDDKFNDTHKWAAIQKHWSVDNLLSFELRYDTAANYFNKKFSCKLQVDIEYEKADRSKQVLRNISLEVNFDTVRGSQHQGIAYYKFKDAHYVKVIVKKMTSSEWGSRIPAIFRLKNEIFIERAYAVNTLAIPTEVRAFDPNSNLVSPAAGLRTANISGTQRMGDIAGQQYLVAWNVQDPALVNYSQFDLEWTFYDIKSVTGNAVEANSFSFSNASLEPLFTNNSSRVTIGQNEYLLNVQYNEGYVFYRVRGVRFDEASGVRTEGSWSYAGSNNGWGYFKSLGHEAYLNWQYNMSFAEDGKRKEVVSYFDGSLRNRQSVTLNNDISGSKTIVQENVFDALGRAAVNILPAPTMENTIHYFHTFNNSNVSGQPYHFSDIEEAGICAKLPSPLSSLSGASLYYSPDNPQKNDNTSQFYFTKYIPDAQGYPLAVTHFTPDNTGRIRTQGGVGPVFQPGKPATADDHTTQYFYAKPVQEELDRLFGNEAGNASHYLKNMVIDANGQNSVSYVNAAGKTVATALAGKSPDNLQPLPSYQLKSTPFITTLTDRDNIVRDAGNLTLTYSGTFLAAATGVFTLQYEFTPLSLQLLYGVQNEKICADCYYDLLVKVTDNCGNTLQTVTQEAVFTEKTTCNPAPTKQQGQLPVTIQKPGEYNITYQLTLSRKAIDFYAGNYLTQNISLKKEIDFKRDYIHQVDISGCYNNCATCLVELGTENDFVAKMTGILQQQHSITANADDISWMKTTYKSLLAECTLLQEGCGKTALPCEEQTQQLRDDVAPGGQYMLYDPSTNTFIERDINVFLLNKPALTQTVTINGATRLFKDLTETELINNWQDSWTDFLLPYHPENVNNCFLNDCGKNAETELYDNSFVNTEDQVIAKNKSYWYEDDYISVVNNDPYFKTGAEGESKKTAFISSLANFKGTNLDIMSFVRWQVYCQKPAGTDQLPATITACPRTTACNRLQDEWLLFRTLYYAAKQEIKEKNKPSGCNSNALFPDPTAAMQQVYNPSAPQPAGCTDIAFFETVKSTANNITTTSIQYTGTQKIAKDVTVQYYTVDINGTVINPAGSVTFLAGTDPETAKPIGTATTITYVINYARCDLSHAYYSKVRRNYNGINLSGLTGPMTNPPPKSSTELNAAAAAAMTTECNESCDQNADGWMQKLEGCNLAISSAQYTQIRDGLLAVCKSSCQVGVADHPFGASSTPTPTVNGDKTFNDVLLRVLGPAGFNTLCNDLLLDYPAPIGVKPLYTNEIVRALSSCAYDKLKAWKNAYNSTAGYSSFSDYVQKTIDPAFAMSDADVNNLLSAYENNCVTPKPVMLPASLSCTATQPKTCLTCTELQDEKINFAAAYSYVPADDPDYYALLAKYINRKYNFNLSSVDVYQALTDCAANTGGIPADTISCAAFTAAYNHFQQLKPDYFTNPNAVNPNPDSLYKLHLTLWLNTELKHNFGFEYYNAKATNCQLSFDYPSTHTINLPFGCDSMAGLVTNFRQHLSGRGVTHAFNSEELEWFSDLHDLVHGGAIQLPDTIRQRPGSWYNSYELRTPALCTGNGLSFQFNFKFLENPPDGNVFYLGFQSQTLLLSRYSGPFTGTKGNYAPGLYLTNAVLFNADNSALQYYGGESTGAEFEYIQLDANPNCVLNPMQLKVISVPGKLSLLYNGRVVYEHVNNPETVINRLALGLRGRNGSIDDIKITDGTGISFYNETFNNADNPALITPAGICPALPDCSTSFTNYVNSLLGTSYNFNQYNDWSWKKCGKIINACCDSCAVDNTISNCSPQFITCCEPFLELQRFRTVFADSVDPRLLAVYFTLLRSQWCTPVNLPNPDYNLPYDSLVSYFAAFKLANGYNITVRPDSLLSYTIDNTGSCTATAFNFLPNTGNTGGQLFAVCNKPAQPTLAADPNSCINQQINQALGNAHTDYLEYIEEIKRDYRDAYYTKCLSITPQLKLEAVYNQPLEYHYTLYYYDQAGNLIKTVPPAGVQPVDDDPTGGAAKMSRIRNFRLADKDYCYEYGDAPALNGSASITVADNPIIQQNTLPFTIEAFVNFNTLGGTQTLLGKQSSNSLDNKTDGYKIYLDNGRLKVDMAAHGAEDWIQTLNKITQYNFPAYYNPPIPPVTIRSKVQQLVPRTLYRSLTAQITSDISGLVIGGQWAHIAVQNTGDWKNPVRIYINGNLVNSELLSNNYDYTPSGSPAISPAETAAGTTEFSFLYAATTVPLTVNNTTAANLVIGAAGNGLNGSIKQVRIYNRALAAAEIRNNAFNTCLVPQSEGSLVIWLPLNKEASIATSLDRINQLTTANTGTVFSSLYQPVYPTHKLPTHYYYNTLNAVSRQTSPDGGTSNFWYDLLGRLVVSQNAEQLSSSPIRAESNNRYSYTKYDLLGRITEVGEKTGAVSMTTAIAKTDPTVAGSAINNWLASAANIQVTQTIYDQPDNTIVTNTAITGNQNIYNSSRKRVVATIYRNSITTATDYNSATHYQYDINGNVKRLWQEHKKSFTGDPVNLLKELKYNYDLVSGKVNSVIYQENKGDQFVYKYEYDPDNRLVRAYSGRDMNTLQQDAGYRYYLHGPLARTELGDATTSRIVQGSDYAYTLQGWLKGVNGTLLAQNGSPGLDMGTDGSNVTAAGLGAQIAADASAYTLGYYQGDYTPIGGSTLSPAFGIQYQHPGITGSDISGKALFNGNISNASYAIAKIDQGRTRGYTYGYDQLNRLKAMQAYNLSSFTASGGAWNLSNVLPGGTYQENYTYDANGNILDLTRNGTTANNGSVNMDKLHYSYYYYTQANVQKTYTPGQALPADAWALTNQLEHVQDEWGASLYPGKLDVANQAANNYTYDKIGNLLKDNAEIITAIKWTVYGKIRSITKSDGTTIVYDYDASGNRIQKQVIDATTVSPRQKTITYYIRDAQGNTISVYSWKGAYTANPAAASTAGAGVANETWDEQDLYGSSRLGIWLPNTPVPITLNTTTGAVQVGSKRYELTNHLGNVLAVITDNKIAVASPGNSSLTDHYEADVVSAQDYYAFGMQMVGRTFNIGSYRYGFNGMEKETACGCGFNQYTTLEREYDERLGRWLSVDPLQKETSWQSPYTAMDNKPIIRNDVNGNCPTCFAGAAMGAVMDMILQIGEHMIQGDNFSTAFKKMDWKSVGKETAIGFGLGALPFLGYGKYIKKAEQIVSSPAGRKVLGFILEQGVEFAASSMMSMGLEFSESKFYNVFGFKEQIYTDKQIDQIGRKEALADLKLSYKEEDGYKIFEEVPADQVGGGKGTRFDFLVTDKDGNVVAVAESKGWRSNNKRGEPKLKGGQKDFYIEGEQFKLKTSATVPSSVKGEVIQKGKIKSLVYKIKVNVFTGSTSVKREGATIFSNIIRRVFKK